MSYTAPTYVDTKEQAVLAVASAIADEDKTNLGNGSVNRALDILADVLAQQDVSVPQTNAGAILALAQYVTGGGGGGVDVGELNGVFMLKSDEPEPSIGSVFNYVSATFSGAYIGDRQITGVTDSIAAGASGVISTDLYDEQPTAYLVAIDFGTGEITSVEPTTIDYSIVEIVVADVSHHYIKLTIPEPDPDGRFLLIGTFAGGK